MNGNPNGEWSWTHGWTYSAHPIQQLASLILSRSTRWSSCEREERADVQFVVPLDRRAAWREAIGRCRTSHIARSSASRCRTRDVGCRSMTCLMQLDVFGESNRALPIRG